MPGQPITIYWTGLSVTAAADLAQITAADDRALEIVSFVVVQSSDVGDAAEEVLRWALYTGVSTGSTGGTAGTVTATQDGGATPGATAHANYSTPSTGGTVRKVGGFNIRIGEERVFPADHRPTIKQANIGSFRLLAAPADAVTLDICVEALEPF